MKAELYSHYVKAGEQDPLDMKVVLINGHVIEGKLWRRYSVEDCLAVMGNDERLYMLERESILAIGAKIAKETYRT